ncbi:MAG: single-stranded-DNA-specific exonuclease RecJ [Gammaproteobacteria bacterium]|nr:single-stranded-DNA-specific exonuclease RecJ [Gammaproteobacteria bacterium]
MVEEWRDIRYSNLLGGYVNKVIVRRKNRVLAQSEGLDPLLAQIFATRGITSLQELERDLRALLPFKDLGGIEQAVTVLFQALEQKKHILIVGDFDADGATSTALAVTALQNFGAQKVSYIVPNRFEYGYGLTPEIVEFAAQQNPDVLVTVDNGISSNEGVASAKSKGWQVVVTDHHLPGAQLPDADAIVNPNLRDDLFQSKALAGVGVIFYVMLALRSYCREQKWFEREGISEPNMAELLDLVALGTVADVVPLDQNNRILIHQGLSRIRGGMARPGILALLEIAGKKPAKLTASDLGFVVGPRLNAAGRLSDMSKGIACLLSTDILVARSLAQELDTLNRERKEIEWDMREQAIQNLKQIKMEKNLPVGLCIFDENWHQGVIGILASRIKEMHHRPVIAFAVSGKDEIKGSARSVTGLHIRDVLDAIASQHPGLVTKFGGHAMAAGLTLPRENFTAFAAAFDSEVRKHLNETDLCGQILSDGELTAIQLNLRTAELLRDAGPWGQGFPEPIFDGAFEVVQQRLLKEKHLKFTLKTTDNNFIDAIAFNIDNTKWPNHHCDQIHVAYRLDINEWQERRQVQLIIEHVEAINGGQ